MLDTMLDTMNNTMNSQNGGTPDITNITESGFIKHVTRFDSETKSELSNLIQYLVIVIIPFYLLNKGITDFMPDFDQSKGNVELLGEVIIHSLSLLLGIYIIHRIVTYLPTFSGDNLAELNFMNIVFLIVFIGLNSDNGKKVNIVYDRIFGNTDETNVGDRSVVKVSQPLNGAIQASPPQVAIQQPIPTHQASRSDYIGEHGQMKPNGAMQEQMQNQAPAPDAGMGAGMGGVDGPMAANDGGYGAFSSF